MDTEPSANENDNGGTSSGLGGFDPGPAANENDNGGYSTGIGGYGGPVSETSSDGATGAPPGLNSTGAKANDADGWGIPEAAANSTGAKANDADGWAGLTKQVEVSANDIINNIVWGISLVARALSGPLGFLTAANEVRNKFNSSSPPTASGSFGSSPGVASTGKGANAAASAFSTGWTESSDRGDSGMAPSPVIGWAGVTVNQAAAAPKVTALPSVGAYKLQSPARLVNAPAAATGSPNQSGSTVSPAVVVAVGLGLLLLA